MCMLLSSLKMIKAIKCETSLYFRSAKFDSANIMFLSILLMLKYRVVRSTIELDLGLSE